MEKATLEDIIQRLDRLEKMITEVNEQLSSLVDVLVPNPLNDFKTGEEVMAYYGRNKKQNAHITEEILDRLFERMGIPPDFDPGSIEDLRESMRQSGIRAEDNEFSRAIIAERER